MTLEMLEVLRIVKKVCLALTVLGAISSLADAKEWKQKTKDYYGRPIEVTVVIDEADYRGVYAKYLEFSTTSGEAYAEFDALTKEEVDSFIDTLGGSLLDHMIKETKRDNEFRESRVRLQITEDMLYGTVTVLLDDGQWRTGRKAISLDDKEEAQK